MAFSFVIGLVVLSLLSGCASTGGGELSGASPAKAKNIILLIGDGMGPSHFGAAWLYSTRVLGKELRMVELMRRGRTAYMVNDTADAIVPESAAAASQMATGEKMTARAVSVAADRKTPVKTILEIAKEKGLAAGLVTTSRITDATPAAFAAHVAYRSDEEAVAVQELQAGVDVLLGGRKQFFLPASAGGKRQDGRDLVEEARQAGYAVVGDAAGLKAASGSKILGLFNMGNLAYEIDRTKTAEPSLAEMAAKTLEILSRNPKGFFAMIEGGRIDHAAHRNDAAGTIHEVLAFDAAVGVALDFQRQDPNTLLIVTADHDTGAMALVGGGRTSKGYGGNELAAIQKVQTSFEVMAGELGKNPAPEQIREVVKKHMAIDLTEDEARTAAGETVCKLGPAPAHHEVPALHGLAFVLRSYLGVGWGSQTHTASPLMLFGSGPGSEELVGFRHNTEVFRLMRAALGG